MSKQLFQVSSRFLPANPVARTKRQPAIVGVDGSALPNLVPQLAFAPAGQQPSGDVLICIFQRGGMDGLSALIPYAEGANYYDLRPTIGVPAPGGGATAAIDLDGKFGLHPSLLPFKDIYDAGKLAVVAATGSVDPTRSHFDAMRFMEQATPGNKTTGTGWIARHLESIASQNTSPFRAVGLGSSVPASLRSSGTLSALALESIVDFHLQGRWDQIDKIRAELSSLYSVAAPTDLLGRQSKLVFDTIDLLDTLSSTTYTAANGAVYPADDYFAFGLMQIAQLIKAQVGLEVACIDIGGWDTHETEGTNGGYFSDLLGSFAKGIAALYTDLGTLTQKVTVVTMSEFGRRAEENASHGTDHGHGNCMFVLGGGVQGGKVYGNWPTLAPDKLDDGDLAITTDQRDVLAELVSKRLKNPALTQVFPNFTPSPLGMFTAA